ncbi:MAG: hypothetical protein AAF591_23790, partial [Verrucomicrobiota bacterium]
RKPDFLTGHTPRFSHRRQHTPINTIDIHLSIIDRNNTKSFSLPFFPKWDIGLEHSGGRAVETVSASASSERAFP